MHRQILCGAVFALCHAWAGLVNGDVTLELDFANTPGAHLSFNGSNSTFTFAPDANGNDFQINNVAGATGSALGLFGTISGTFTVGAIVGNEAPVSGNGVLTVSDGSQNLTADIRFLAIEKMGSLAEFNPDQVVNLTNVHYAGSNQDLLALAGSSNPSALVGFFDSHTLTQLKSGGQPVSTGFAGDLDPVAPEPGAMAVFLGAVGGFWLARRRRKAAGQAARLR